MGRRNAIADWASSAGAHGLIAAAMALPYPARVRFAGAMAARLLGPGSGATSRAARNIARVWPEMPRRDVARLARASLDNMGRTLIETYSFEELRRRCGGLPLSGPGWEALVAARRDGRPAILFTGHFGNYGAARLALQARGLDVGVLYRPFSNPRFEARHRVVQDRFGTAFPRGSAGMRDMVRHLAGGGVLAIVGDQHVADGAPLRFFGLPAATATSAAQLAVRYGADLVPVYGIRRPDGLDFEVTIEPPVPPASPEAMTQALNDSLEAIVRRHPGQWLWAHRRWKLADRIATGMPGPSSV